MGQIGLMVCLHIPTPFPSPSQCPSSLSLWSGAHSAHQPLTMINLTGTVAVMETVPERVDIPLGVMVYSDWLTPGPGPVTGTGTGKLVCILCRTFHTTPELGPVSGLGNTRMGFKPNFQDLKSIPEMNCNWILATFTIFKTSSALKWHQHVGK